MTSRTFFAIALAALAMSTHALAGGDAALVGVDRDGDLYTIDTATAKTTLLHDLPEGIVVGSIAFDPVSRRLGILGGANEPGTLTLINADIGAIGFSGPLMGLPPGQEKTGGLGYDGNGAGFVVTFGQTGTFNENRLALVDDAGQVIAASGDIGLGDSDGCFWDALNSRLIVNDYNAADGFPRVASVSDPFGAPVIGAVANPPSDGSLGDTAADPVSGRIFITRFVGASGELVELVGNSYVTVGAFDAPTQIVGLAFVTIPEGCSGADVAEPFGTLNFNDVIAFLTAFGDMDPDVDLAEPIGTLNFNDVIAYLSLFSAGCP